VKKLREARREAEQISQQKDFYDFIDKNKRQHFEQQVNRSEMRDENIEIFENFQRQHNPLYFREVKEKSRSRSNSFKQRYKLKFEDEINASREREKAAKLHASPLQNQVRFQQMLEDEWISKSSRRRPLQTILKQEQQPDYFVGNGDRNSNLYDLPGHHQRVSTFQLSQAKSRSRDRSLNEHTYSDRVAADTKTTANVQAFQPAYLVDYISSQLENLKRSTQKELPDASRFDPSNQLGKLSMLQEEIEKKYQQNKIDTFILNHAMLL